MSTSYHSKGIYAIQNNVNNKIYVGMTKTDFELRWMYHIMDLMNGVHTNTQLQKDFDRYGIECFTFFILEEVLSTKVDIERRELQWIRTMEKTHKLYNVKGTSKRYYRRYSKKVRKNVQTQKR